MISSVSDFLYISTCPNAISQLFPLPNQLPHYINLPKMPTVLITGINGFVAVHTAVKYLENGWNVRGTVRSADKGDKALALPVFKQYKDKIDYVIVEDLIKGDFNEALKGVDAIAHCASPWHFNGKKWAEYRDPAVKGTTNVLEQAAKVDSELDASVAASR
jgi:nucleoside-diphosphate-sugar epimerase